MVTVSVNQSRFNEQLLALIDASKADAATVIEDEARLAQKQFITLTPPPGLGGAAKLMGEGAVTRDIGRLFTGVDETLMEAVALSAHRTSNIDTWLTGANGTPVHYEWDRMDPSGSGMAAFHNNHRDSRGRAYKLKKEREGAWYAPYVVTKQDFYNYRAKIKEHVGRRKAAWAVGYTGPLQGWIKRHVSGARGSFLSSLSNTSRPFVRISNSSVGIGQDEHIISSAFRIRCSAIKRKIQGIFSGYSAQWKAGVKIKKQERSKFE